MSRTIKGLTGTVAVTQYSAAITGSSTDWDTSMEGKYIRIGQGTRIYTINAVTSTTALTLTERYQEPTGSGLQFQIGDGERLLRIQLIDPPEATIENQADRIGHFPEYDNS